MPAKMTAKHILVKKLSQAEAVLEDIKKGKKFEDVAKLRSTCSSKRKGGSIGEFDKQKVVPEFWNACLKLKKNEISGPVKSQFGYHIIKRVK